MQKEIKNKKYYFIVQKQGVCLKKVNKNSDLSKK